MFEMWDFLGRWVFEMGDFFREMGGLKCGVFFGRCITILKFSADEKSPDGATRGKPCHAGASAGWRLVARGFNSGGK